MQQYFMNMMVGSIFLSKLSGTLLIPAKGTIFKCIENPKISLFFSHLQLQIQARDLSRPHYYPTCDNINPFI